MWYLLFLLGAVSTASCFLTDQISRLKVIATPLLQIGEHPQKLTRILDYSSFPDKSQEPQRAYSWSEVSSCDGENGKKLLVVFENNVYDVTDFADYHPPGARVLKQLAGQDATGAMKASGMPTRVYDVFLNRFLIGWLG